MDFAHATDLGGRTTQQDDFLALPKFITIGDKDCSIFAIFDGHGNQDKAYIRRLGWS